MSEKNIYYYGIEENLPSIKELRAGKLKMQYETGFLRYIKIGKNEILRMIYFAVRDHNWDTIEGTIKNEKIEIKEDHFRISYRSVHEKGGIEMSFMCWLTGDKNGHIEFEIDGEAGSTFMKNRIGFCVLHPILECVNKTCYIEHWNDSISQIKFPEYISPSQPFRDIRSMKWSVNDSYDVKVQFEGDIFETEDQRNWTDASFKTYCTPLDHPFPVKIRTGEKVNQKIKMDILEKKADITFTPDTEEFIFSVLNDSGIKFPALGVGASSSYHLLDAKSLEKIKRLKLDHIRWDLNLTRSDLEKKIAGINRQTNTIGTSACLALLFSNNPVEAYQRLVYQVKGKLNRLKYFLLFDQTKKTTPDNLIDLLADRIRQDFPSIQIGGGTNVYFTELNRNRVKHDKLDFIVYSINPQVHAYDNLSLTETLEAQSETVQSAKHFSAGKDIMISPVTLKPRFNPNATCPEPEPDPGHLPSQVDVRQMSLYGAGWTLISIKYLAEAGVKGITYFETAGWRGLIQGNRSSSLNKKFKTQKDDYFPIYLVFDWLKELKNGLIIRSKSSFPLKFDGLTVRDQGIYHIFLVNFTINKLTVRIEGPGYPTRQKYLSFDNIKNFIKNSSLLDEVHLDKFNKIELRPYSINWLTLG